jgi:hypothetical protein
MYNVLAHDTVMYDTGEEEEQQHKTQISRGSFRSLVVVVVVVVSTAARLLQPLNVVVVVVIVFKHVFQ